jgi:hypothetical protein
VKLKLDRVWDTGHRNQLLVIVDGGRNISRSNRRNFVVGRSALLSELALASVLYVTRMSEYVTLAVC